MINQTESELRFRWQVAPGILRPCITAQIWRPSQAGHMSNGSWISVDCLGGVYLICLHPQCLQRGYCNRRLLGQVPLSLLSLFSSGSGGGAPPAADGGRGNAGGNSTTSGGAVVGGGSSGEYHTAQPRNGSCAGSGGGSDGAGLNLGMEMSRWAAAPARQMMKRRSSGENLRTLTVPDSDLEHAVAPLVPDSGQEGASPVPPLSSPGLEAGKGFSSPASCAPPNHSRADAPAAGQSTSPPGDPRDQHYAKLSREQSLARVADENQQEKVFFI
jgi:hypothetical protein